MTEPLAEYISLDRWKSGRNDMVAVTLKETVTDIGTFAEKNIVVDGVERKIVGIERFAHQPPWSQGDVVALVLKHLETT